MPVTYEPIATTTLGAAAANITFSSISSAYTDLKIIVANYKTASGTQDICLRLNGDSSTVYSFTAMRGDGTLATSNRGTAYPRAMLAPGSWSSTTVPATSIIDIFNYLGSTNKTILCKTAAEGTEANQIHVSVNLWRNTSAINSVAIFTSGSVNISAGTTATLYGIKKA